MQGAGDGSRWGDTQERDVLGYKEQHEASLSDGTVECLNCGAGHRNT